jgi:hypothetical protein
MLVEALWRNFKRMVLHHYNRPRVDFATYALVTQGITPYRVRFNKIIRNPRMGVQNSYVGSKSRSSAHGLHFENARSRAHMIWMWALALFMRSTKVPLVLIVQTPSPGTPTSQP